MAPGPVVLSSQDDWLIWLNQIKIFANARGVWEYVDPHATSPKVLHEPPAPRYTDIRPSARSLAELDKEELTRWLLLSTDHNNTTQQFEKIRCRLGEVHLEIIHTVSRENQRYLIGPEGPRDAILRLAGELAPRETQAKQPPQDVISRWKELQLVTPQGDLSGWLARWYFLYKEGKAAGIPEVAGKRPLLAFLYVVDQIAPKFSVEWDCKIEKDTSIDLPKLLREFQKWQKLHPKLLSVYPKQHGETAIEPLASLPAQNSRAAKSDPKRQPEHKTAETPTSYPIQSVLRYTQKYILPKLPAQSVTEHHTSPPNVQKGSPKKLSDDEVYKFLAGTLAQNGHAEEILNELERQTEETAAEPPFSPTPPSNANQVRKKKPKKPFRKNPGPPAECLCGKLHFFSDCPYVVEALRPSVWPNDREIRAKFDEMAQSNPRFKELIERAAENGNSKHSKNKIHPIPEEKLAWIRTLTRENMVGSEFALKNSFIIDIVASVHVCNDRSRMVNFRPADDPLKPFDGKTRIRGYGTVDIQPSPASEDCSQLMTLRDVAYVPGFLANIVSGKLLEESGYFWDISCRELCDEEGTALWRTPKLFGFFAIEYKPLLPEVSEDLVEEPASMPMYSDYVKLYPSSDSDSDSF